MNASVSIQSRFEKDVLQVPLQTVYSVQKKSFCLVKKGDQFETREVEIDGNNSKMILVRSGLSKGEKLVMNPGLYKDRMDLPEVQADPRIELAEGEMLAKDDSQRSGGLTPVSVASGGPPRGGGRPSGGRPSGGRPSGGSMAAGIMSKYDTNKDDVIDKAEMASLEERSKGFVSRADSNKDGQVTKAELTKMAANMSSQWGGGGDRGGPSGGGGRGRPSVAPSAAGANGQTGGGTP